MHSDKQKVRRMLSWFAVLAVAGCASLEPGRMSAETSTPMPVDPRADNEAVIAGQTAALVVTLKIDGAQVALADSRVMMVPMSDERRQEGDMVALEGLSGGQTVTRVAVPDQRLNVQENRGLVMLEQRTLQAALPLPRPIDELQVRLPGSEQPVRIAVDKEIATFCRTHPQQDLCRTAKQDLPTVK
jgi:hypothetical protein